MFDNLSSETASIRNDLDKLFDVDNPSNLSAHFPNAKRKTISHVCNIIKPKINEWKIGAKLPRYSDCISPIDVQNELDKCPWMIDLFPDHIESTALYLFEQTNAYGKRPMRKPSGDYIQRYAYFVAKHGYFNNGQGSVDHGFSSGCLVMQLTGLRYWIIEQIKKYQDNNNNFYMLLDDLISAAPQAKHPGFGYEKESLLGNISLGCHAAACHNILPDATKYNKHLPFRINNSVILFLSCALDEIQKWHRPPVGNDIITRPFKQ